MKKKQNKTQGWRHNVPKLVSWDAEEQPDDQGQRLETDTEDTEKTGKKQAYWLIRFNIGNGHLALILVSVST